MQRGTPDLQRSPRKRSAELRALLHIEEDAEEEQTTQETSALVDASSPAPHIRNEHQPAESSNAGLQTPVLKGVREMFQQRQVPDTPAFEGMAEMLEPPQLPSQEESMEERPADDLPSPTPLPKRRTVNKSRLPKAVQSETPSLADDEASPLPTTVDPAESAPAKTPALRLLRSRRTPASEVKVRRADIETRVHADTFLLSRRPRQAKHVKYRKRGRALQVPRRRRPQHLLQERCRQTIQKDRRRSLSELAKQWSRKRRKTLLLSLALRAARASRWLLWNHRTLPAPTSQNKVKALLRVLPNRPSGAPGRPLRIA